MSEVHTSSVVIDIDGTLCKIRQGNEVYGDLTPYGPMVERLRELKKEGFKIILYTARSMRSYNSNLGMINKNTARSTMDWLDKWDIPYDEIYFGKPWVGPKGFYVDDRAVRPSELLKMTSSEILTMTEREGNEKY